jgi:hypothetical protein
VQVVKYRTVVLALLVGLLGAQAYAQPTERSWRVYMKHIGGPITYCVSGGHYWIREGNGRFSMFDSDSKVELWTLPMAADGSVAGETKNSHSKRPIRVTVAVGADPRAFDTLDLSLACRYRWEPM